MSRLDRDLVILRRQLDLRWPALEKLDAALLQVLAEQAHAQLVKAREQLTRRLKISLSATQSPKKSSALHALELAALSVGRMRKSGSKSKMRKSPLHSTLAIALLSHRCRSNVASLSLK